LNIIAVSFLFPKEKVRGEAEKVGGRAFYKNILWREKKDLLKKE
jgi:hypothetical protein